MSAHLIPVREVHPLVGLTARLALLNAELQDFRRDLDAAIETPFGIARLLEDAETTHRYSADEDPIER